MTMQIAIPAPTYFQISYRWERNKVLFLYYYSQSIIPNPDTTSYKE